MSLHSRPGVQYNLIEDRLLRIIICLDESKIAVSSLLREKEGEGGEAAVYIFYIIHYTQYTQYVIKEKRRGLARLATKLGINPELRYMFRILQFLFNFTVTFYE